MAIIYQFDRFATGYLRSLRLAYGIGSLNEKNPSAMCQPLGSRRYGA